MTKETRIPETRAGVTTGGFRMLTFLDIRHSGFVSVVLETSGFAGGLRPVRRFREWSDTRAGRSRRFPSPSGREQRASRRESRKVWIVLRGEKGSPSSQRRGPGEGKEGTARRGYFALSHSRFQASGYAGGL